MKIGLKIGIGTAVLYVYNEKNVDKNGKYKIFGGREWSVEISDADDLEALIRSVKEKLKGEKL